MQSYLPSQTPLTTRVLNFSVLKKGSIILVDEVHLCARPHSNFNVSKQQKRYELVSDLSAAIKNVLFLTATPHNGYSDTFASILEILNSEIVSYHNGGEISFDKSKARFNVIQRNRRKLENWYTKQGQKSPFPKRDQTEEIITPNPHGKYMQLLDAIERYGDFILTAANVEGTKKVRNIANWVAFHFQKRVISSPYAVLMSLENRINTIKNKTYQEEDTNAETLQGYVYDMFSDDERISEEMASLKLDFEALNENEISELQRIIDFTRTLTPRDDEKLTRLKDKILPELFSKDTKIIVFTKYRDTLDYLEKNIKSREFDVFIMHGDMSQKARSDIFQKFDRAVKAVLIATDVISEGLNLQRLASSIVHYELPWNPNRLEQRNGRIDRIGQPKQFVHIRTLVLDNSLDKEILDLLLEKQRTIEVDRDYAAAYFGDEVYLSTIIDQASKRNKSKKKNGGPVIPDLFSAVGVDETRKAVKQSFSINDEDLKRKKKIESESFYSSLDIELPEIDKRIAETKRIVGSQAEVLLFVKSALQKFSSGMSDIGNGFYEIYLNDPRIVLSQFGNYLPKVTFDPELALTHPEALILDAGHPLVRKIIELVKAEFFSNKGMSGRNAYYFSETVESVIYQYNFLVRFTVGLKEKRVIEEIITLAIDSFSEKCISFENIQPSTTTRMLAAADLTEQLKDALSNKSLDSLIQQKIQDRKIKLIEERQELYKKILVDSMNTDQPAWLDDIIHLENAGYDLLTITIIQPL